MLSRSMIYNGRKSYVLESGYGNGASVAEPLFHILKHFTSGSAQYFLPLIQMVLTRHQTYYIPCLQQTANTYTFLRRVDNHRIACVHCKKVSRSWATEKKRDIQNTFSKEFRIRNRSAPSTMLTAFLGRTPKHPYATRIVHRFIS